MTLPSESAELTLRIARAVHDNKGRALLVGGYPRDLIMHRELGKKHVTKDLDLEVFGLTADELIDIIEKFHPVNKVGVSFGVLKVGPLDVALPRKDSKRGQGHRGFSIATDPHMSLKDAGRRRDFTVNTIAMDPLTGEIFDEWGGVEDIKNRTLKAVDPAFFGDDPLRALRAMQFAGRFDFTINEATQELCRQQDLASLSEERIGEEWLKLLLKSEKPSIGLKAAWDLQIIQKLHPQMEALYDTPQEPAWHPEGSVWNHTLLTVDKAAEIARREKLKGDEQLTLLLAALTHDFGKPLTTVEQGGRIRSPDHAKAGQAPAHDFMKQLHINERIIKKVCRLIYDHMFLPEAARAKDPAIRRLAKRLQPATIQELLWVTEADFYGRGLAKPDFSLGRLLKKRAEELAVTEHAPKPLVLGRDLILLGERPGPRLGEILKQLEAAQINGRFTTKASGLRFYQDEIAR